MRTSSSIKSFMKENLKSMWKSDIFKTTKVNKILIDSICAIGTKVLVNWISSC